MDEVKQPKVLVRVLGAAIPKASQSPHVKLPPHHSYVVHTLTSIPHALDPEVNPGHKRHIKPDDVEESVYVANSLSAPTFFHKRGTEMMRSELTAALSHFPELH